VRSARGITLPWYEELQRYDALLSNRPNADGGLGRRVPVLVMFLSLAASFVVLLRRGKMPGAALGPSRRLLGAAAGSLVLLALTPTKWTHHFGAFAGIGACVAAVAVIAVAAPAMHARLNGAVFISALLLAMALAATGDNSWWYASSYGISWFDRPAAQQVPGRLVVRRIPDLNPAEGGGQATLFDTWRFHAFFTTSELDAVTADTTHRHHAIIEQVHADLKNSALAHLPSSRFATNGAWLVLATMAFNLTRAAATITGSSLAKATTATIRRTLITVPARIASSARRLTLHLPTAWP
jgi:hypothetical protein